jgi:TadE-like protein
MVSAMRRIEVRAGRGRERGQALVEFALLAPLFLLIVVGIIQFGVGLNYWLDMQRIANQGARWAVVNNWPTCPRGSTSCTNYDTPPFTQPQALRNYLHHELLSEGLRDDARVFICYPDDGSPTTDPEDVGTPVRVRIETPFDFAPIIPFGSMNLSAEATMRLEQEPTLIVDEQGSCAPAP